MWDSFLSGVATSIMLNQKNNNGENEFAVMEYMNITVITSNEPYGISDGSNPFFDGLKKPKFDLKNNGVHSGHVQTGLRDPFCVVKNRKGRCKVKCQFFTKFIIKVCLLCDLCVSNMSLRSCTGWLYNRSDWWRRCSCSRCHTSQTKP